MSKSNRRMRIRHTPSQSIKMKTTTRVIVAAGCSVLLLGAGIFIYMNVSNVESSKAGIATDRIIPVTIPKSDLHVSAVVLLPIEQQPAKGNNPTVVNKRALIQTGQ